MLRFNGLKTRWLGVRIQVSFGNKLAGHRSRLEETGWLGVTLALCVFGNTLAGTKIVVSVVSMSRNDPVRAQTQRVLRGIFKGSADVFLLFPGRGEGYQWSCHGRVSLLQVQSICCTRCCWCTGGIWIALRRGERAHPEVRDDRNHAHIALTAQFATDGWKCQE